LLARLKPTNQSLVLKGPNGKFPFTFDPTVNPISFDPLANTCLFPTSTIKYGTFCPTPVFPTLEKVIHELPLAYNGSSGWYSNNSASYIEDGRNCMSSIGKLYYIGVVYFLQDAKWPIFSTLQLVVSPWESGSCMRRCTITKSP
jgi:hypothetical protein